MALQNVVRVVGNIIEKHLIEHFVKKIVLKRIVVLQQLWELLLFVVGRQIINE
tara:strand:- start:205 stop:363 length:159 start_codon:yes stop_codon:yes gene_type:complete